MNVGHPCAAVEPWCSTTTRAQWPARTCCGTQFNQTNLLSRRWDIYTPVSNLVFHHYARAKAKSVFADHSDGEWWATVQQTHLKTKFLLGLSPERPGPELSANMSRYGMGQERKVSGFDHINHIRTSSRNTHYGPY